MPPRPGAPRPQDAGAQNQALDAMFGAPAPRSAGENAALDAAGRNAADIGARSTVGSPGTNVVDKGTTTRDIVAAPEGDGKDAPREHGRSKPEHGRDPGTQARDRGSDPPRRNIAVVPADARGARQPVRFGAPARRRDARLRWTRPMGSTSRCSSSSAAISAMSPRGDFGPSLVYKDFTVSELIAQGLPVSLALGGLALLLAAGLGVGTGIAVR